MTDEPARGARRRHRGRARQLSGCRV